MDWNGNLDSPIGKSARLVIWRSEFRIPVLVQIFLLKSKLNILCLDYLENYRPNWTTLTSYEQIQNSKRDEKLKEGDPWEDME